MRAEFFWHARGSGRCCCGLRWASAKRAIKRINLFFPRRIRSVGQLPATLVGWSLLALLTGGGFGLRLLLTGNIRGVLAWLVGALFIPTFALALGVWSGTGKPFEILYTLLWYVGPMHAIPQLDFMGSAPATAVTHYPFIYLALAAMFGRRGAGRPPTATPVLNPTSPSRLVLRNGALRFPECSLSRFDITIRTVLNCVHWLLVFWGIR